MKTILAVLTILCFHVLVFAGDGKTIKGEVGDSFGKLLYKTYTRGNATEAREPSGKLVTKSKRRTARPRFGLGPVIFVQSEMNL